MTSTDRSDAEGALRFERSLLESARADELPGNVAEAWARFGASLGAAGGLAATGAAASSSGASAALAPEAVRRALQASAGKWLFVGLFCGSALTVFGMSRLGAFQNPVPVAPPTALANVSAIPAPTIAGSAISLVHEFAPATLAPSAALARATRPRAQSGRAAVQVSSAARASAAEAVPVHSTLAAQVALLDSARTAIAAGAFGEALGLTERYQVEFPTGELAPEAEVVAIEALSGQGDREALSARAQRFLARYPADPHAARVKALAAR